MEDITEKEKDSEESWNAVNARERVGKTKKRQEEGEETVSTKGRCRSGDMSMGYLREKS